MKVLWLCNRNPLDQNLDKSGGWFSSLSKLFLDSSNRMIFLFPSTETQIEEKPNYTIASFKMPFFAKEYKNDHKIACFFEKVISLCNPEIIHIWGTEFYYDLTLARIAKRRGLIERTVVHIQGLCTAISEHLTTALPFSIIVGKTPRDFLLGSISNQRRRFIKRSKNEIELLKTTQNIIGRTFWDKRCCEIINSKLNYFYCSESLRPEFYSKKWTYNGCMKHTIFISQASYSLKGLHIVLRAFPYVLQLFPDAHIYIAGNNLIRSNKKTGFLSISRYGLYIKQLIKRLKIEKNITFLGPLNQKEMAYYYMKTNVYLLSSFIENSPNSLGEALCVGSPVIASFVGGVPEFINNGENGFLYQADDYLMLASYINTLFSSQEICERFSENGKRAIKIFDPNKVYNDVMKIYEKLNNVVLI